MKYKLLFFAAVFFLCSNTLLAQNSPRNITLDAEQTQQSLETISTELGKVSKSLEVFNKRMNDFLESLSKYKGIQLTEKQQRIIFGYEVLNQTEQLAATLRKSLVETGEREATIRRRIIQIEFDMRPENIDRSIQLVGTTKAEEARAARRQALDAERNVLRSTLVEIENSRREISENLKQAEQFAQSFRRSLLNLAREEMKDF